MKSFFVAALAVPALLGLISLDVSAQSLPNHPDDPNAKRIDTIQVIIALPPTMISPSGSDSASSGDPASLQSAATNDVRSLVIAWRTSDGRVDYTIEPSSIHCSGTAVDGYTTSALMEMISRTAVVKGVGKGYTSCTSSTAAAAIVYRNSYIYRTGSGSTTSFISWSPSAFCRYAFIASCTAAGTDPMLTEISVANRCDGGTPVTATID